MRRAFSAPAGFWGHEPRALLVCATPLASQLVEVVRGYEGSWGKLLPETTELLPLEHVSQILAALDILVRLGLA